MKLIYGIWTSFGEGRLVAVFMNANEANIFADDHDLLVTEHEVDEDFEAITNVGILN